MATSSKQPTRMVNVLIAQDLMPDTFLPDQILQHVKARKNIKARTLTWHSELSGETWELRDAQARRKHDVPSDELVEWADLLVVVCMGAGHLSIMLQGGTDVFLLELLRSWDVSKRILLVPGMSCAMWENPMTKKQLNKIRRKWNWIHVFEPVLWHGRTNQEEVVRSWTGLDELVEGVKNHADLISIGHDLEVIPMHQTAMQGPSQTQLPLELWSLIFEYVGDWEVAKALGIYTNLPWPTEWELHRANAPGSIKNVQRASDLEWAVLMGTYSQVVDWFTLHPPSPRWLSRLSVKLIIKFARTDVLTYLESHHKDVFWSTFGHTLLPTKASAVFGKVAILDWWKTSPSFLTKEYTVEALDAASKAGFIHILEWWRASGLPLRYTEAALEQASARGNLDVLEWWRSASLIQSDEEFVQHEHPDFVNLNACYTGDTENGATLKPSGAVAQPVPPLRLKVGKSIVYAAQNGQAATLEWWLNSSILTAHEDAVARIASANGHVNVLQLWKHCKGEKMQYDNQVLVGPTKNGHLDVLRWWKQSGYTVEYKTCDIEEALEDSLGGSGEDRIRAWWARNGLNLGVGTSEWMKVKIL